jgi:hypothetical protein
MATKEELEANLSLRYSKERPTNTATFEELEARLALRNDHIAFLGRDIELRKKLHIRLQTQLANIARTIDAHEKRMENLYLINHKQQGVV